ncbi:MAG: histidinol-phosphate transaminase [Candidatus Aquirickettsiella sp.]
MTISSKKNFTFNAEKPAEIIKLDLNENPFGASPLAIAAGQQAMLNCHRYPDNHGLSLKKSLSIHLSVLPENITLGNGSESLLELIVKNTLGPLNSAVIPNFCFTGISKILKNANVKIKIAKNSHSYISGQHLLDTIEPMTRIIFIVNPNNPTGNYMNKSELLYLLKHLPKTILVVIDEAYAEYVEAEDYPNSIQLITRYSNLIILRTFSKLYGLAGLRLGYAISGFEIASMLNLRSLPFRVNAIVLAAAEASLNDQEHINLARLLNRQGHSQLSKGLQKLGLETLPSFTNFLCVDLKSPSWPIYQLLLLYGISVRPLLDYGLSNFLRVSIGTEKQNRCFLSLLEKILVKSHIH